MWMKDRHSRGPKEKGQQCNIEYKENTLLLETFYSYSFCIIKLVCCMSSLRFYPLWIL